MLEQLEVIRESSVRYAKCCRYEIAEPSGHRDDLLMFSAFSSPEVDYRDTNSALNDESETVPDIGMRSDMSETAFFMPTLRTDKNGNVRMEFRRRRANRPCL